MPYVIDGIRVHRISRYTSTDDKTVMKISEITELDIDGLAVPDTDIVAFKAVVSDSHIYISLSSLLQNRFLPNGTLN